MAPLFVASVPGKYRQSLVFGLCGFGFFELRGIGRSPMASSWMSWSVSGLFSNPPEAELFPVMLRRFPRRNRSATGCVSLCLPGFQRLLHFSRWPGRLGPSRMLAARIGPRILVMLWARCGGFCVLALLRARSSRGRKARRAVSAFVASVPGKDRQSLVFVWQYCYL